MPDDFKGYGALESMNYDRLKTGDDDAWDPHKLATLDLLNSEVAEEPLHLTPETDQWECTTTLTCCALNAFVLAFNIMVFVPVSEAVRSDFNFSQMQVPHSYHPE
jgi:hypothetical protein